jgi:hypothetical protein
LNGEILRLFYDFEAGLRWKVGSRVPLLPNSLHGILNN